MTAPEYCTALALASAQIIAAVHDANPAEVRRHIRAALSLKPPPGVAPYEALMTVLAAQANPDTTLSERLAWVAVLPVDEMAAA